MLLTPDTSVSSWVSGRNRVRGTVSVVEGAKGPQEHLDTGSAELEITVKSVSERKARKKRDEYRDPDPQDGIYTTDS